MLILWKELNETVTYSTAGRMAARIQNGHTIRHSLTPETERGSFPLKMLSHYDNKKFYDRRKELAKINAGGQSFRSFKWQYLSDNT
jgi:hypothetical protein